MVLNRTVRLFDVGSTKSRALEDSSGVRYLLCLVIVHIKYANMDSMNISRSTIQTLWR
ncbi:hypothetical protein RND71_032947 [Anisodus tanguticus]|uniref:Uncharacterized protein n=1 Tax=Anisodus tanguticus TaxID=243964 RepID=A0AAE1R8B3_9SOLA|nr:hypothetical protein RND71_032947 [Anisodus tanguticus]